MVDVFYFLFSFFFYYKSPFPLDILFYIRHIYRMIIYNGFILTTENVHSSNCVSKGSTNGVKEYEILLTCTVIGISHSFTPLVDHLLAQLELCTFFCSEYESYNKHLGSLNHHACKYQSCSHLIIRF